MEDTFDGVRLGEGGDHSHAAMAARAIERVDEKDILTAVDLERDKADSERLVKDAVYAINRKAKAELGIKDALVWKKLTAWVNDEYVSDFLGG